MLPISAALAGRLPPIAVKLKGETAKTKPSSGRYSIRFHTPWRGDRLLLVDPRHELDVEAVEVDRARRRRRSRPGGRSSTGRASSRRSASSARGRRAARRRAGRSRRAPPRASRDQSSQASPAASIARSTSFGAALVDVGEHVALAVGHDGLGRRAGGHVLAADHERDLDPLALHLVEPAAELLALGRSGRVVLDGLVDRLRRVGRSRGAHAVDSTIPASGVRRLMCVTKPDGWGVGELWLEGDRLLHHELPRPGAARERRGAPARRRLVALLRRRAGTTSATSSSTSTERRDFERALTEALRRVPCGRDGHLRRAGRARRASERAAGSWDRSAPATGSASSSRATGSSAADGLGSYGSLGVGYKRRLLELEGVSV